MGGFSWLLGEKEEKPPEHLVLGAELACSYGEEHSFLIVQSDDKDINGLPEACVLDRERSVNITPFGYCASASANCSMIMELEEQWENEEPQKTLSNGKEIITTRSTLLCKACGGEIKAVTSGQDGVEAARISKEIELVREMAEKYPGLLDILVNPYGSLYLEGDMYQAALRFLEDCVEKNGGSVWILGLYSDRSLENSLITSCLEQLLTIIGTERENAVIQELNMIGFKNGKQAGWDVYTLNKEVIEMLRKDCEKTAKKIEGNAYLRWKEENKQQLEWYSENFLNLVYFGLIYYWSMGLRLPETYEQEALAENVKRLEAIEEGIVESEAEAMVEGEGDLGAYKVPGGGGGITSTIEANGQTVNFGHGGRHLEGTSLNVNAVNQALANEVSTLNLSTGQFHRGQIIIDGIINIGTYYPLE